MLGRRISYPQEGFVLWSTEKGALGPRMVFSAPRPVAFVGIDAGGSGTGKPPLTFVEVVVSVVVGPPSREYFCKNAAGTICLSRVRTKEDSDQILRACI